MNLLNSAITRGKKKISSGHGEKMKKSKTRQKRTVKTIKTDSQGITKTQNRRGKKLSRDRFSLFSVIVFPRRFD